MMSHRLSRVRLAALVAMLVAATTPAFAQLDPLFFLKGQAATSVSPNMAPNVVFVVLLFISVDDPAAKRRDSILQPCAI